LRPRFSVLGERKERSYQSERKEGEGLFFFGEDFAGRLGKMLWGHLFFFGTSLFPRCLPIGVFLHFVILVHAQQTKKTKKRGCLIAHFGGGLKSLR
jgi:hypothetical protein